MAGKGNPKTGGRKKGVTNKTTALLKDAVLQAAELAGDKKGMVGYLTQQAQDNPTAFLSLLGKVLSIQAKDTPNEEKPITINIRIGEADKRQSITAADAKVSQLPHYPSPVNEAA